MRIIRRKADELVRSHLFEKLQELLLRHFLQRLGRKADMLPNDVTWLALQPRHFMTQIPILLIHFPHEMRNICEPSLNHNQLQIWKFLKYAIENHTRHLHHMGCGDKSMPFNEIPWKLPKVDRGFVMMHRNPQSMALSRFIDRMIVRLSPWDIIDRQQHLQHLGVRSHTVNFSDRRLRILGTDVNRPIESIILPQPVLDLPIVVS